MNKDIDIQVRSNTEAQKTQKREPSWVEELISVREIILTATPLPVSLGFGLNWLIDIKSLPQTYRIRLTVICHDGILLSFSFWHTTKTEYQREETFVYQYMTSF